MKVKLQEVSPVQRWLVVSFVSEDAALEKLHRLNELAQGCDNVVGGALRGTGEMTGVL